MKKISMSSLFKMVAATALVLAFASCENPSDPVEEKPVEKVLPFATNTTAEYVVAWEGAFNPDYTSDSVKVYNVAAKTAVVTSQGAMALNKAGASTQNYSFATLQVESGAWGGVFFKTEAPIDSALIDATSKMYVLISGDLGTVQYLGMKYSWNTGDNDGVEKNILNYPKTTFTDSDSTVYDVYAIPMADFASDADLKVKWNGFGIWNPNSVNSDDVAVRDLPANYPGLTDVRVGVFFGD